jgi:hypothetical protein
MAKSSENSVSRSDFQKNLKRHIKLAANGRGPVFVRKGKQVVGVFMSSDDYNALCGSLVRELLRSRRNGATVAQEAARKKIRTQRKQQPKKR